MGQEFHARLITGGIAVPFPANQTLDRIAIFHTSAIIQPVIGIGAGPIASADAAKGEASSHE